LLNPQAPINRNPENLAFIKILQGLHSGHIHNKAVIAQLLSQLFILNNKKVELTKQRYNLLVSMEIKQSLYSYTNQHKKTLTKRLYKLDKNIDTLKGNVARLITQLVKNPAKYSANYQFSELKGKLPMPVKGEFKVIRTNKSTGALYIQPENNAVLAIAKGKVVFSGLLQSLGKVVVIAHGNDYFSIYGQLASISVKEKTTVKQGQIVALIGGQNVSLSFMMRRKDKIINPKYWLVAFNK